MTGKRYFLVLASYYQRFINIFSVIEAPLMEITSNMKTFPWMDDMRVAIENMKEFFMIFPGLAYFNVESRKDIQYCCLVQVDDRFVTWRLPADKKIL